MNCVISDKWSMRSDMWRGTCDITNQKNCITSYLRFIPSDLWHVTSYLKQVPSKMNCLDDKWPVKSYVTFLMASDRWYMPSNLWYVAINLACNICQAKWIIWLVTYEIKYGNTNVKSRVIYDKWHVTCDKWLVTHDNQKKEYNKWSVVWYVTYYKWILTLCMTTVTWYMTNECDFWQVTCNTWQVKLKCILSDPCNAMIFDIWRVKWHITDNN